MSFELVMSQERPRVTRRTTRSIDLCLQLAHIKPFAISTSDGTSHFPLYIVARLRAFFMGFRFNRRVGLFIFCIHQHPLSNTSSIHYE